MAVADLAGNPVSPATVSFVGPPYLETDAGAGFSDEIYTELRTELDPHAVSGGFSDEIEVTIQDAALGKDEEREELHSAGFEDELEWNVSWFYEPRTTVGGGFEDALRFLHCNPTGENHFEEAVGVANGSNVWFTTDKSYVPGTLRVFLNGRLVTKRLDDGFAEEWPPAFRMKVAPKSTDSLFVFYEECSAP